jgi:hypothetical protein
MGIERLADELVEDPICLLADLGAVVYRVAAAAPECTSFSAHDAKGRLMSIRHVGGGCDLGKLE